MIAALITCVIVFVVSLVLMAWREHDMGHIEATALSFLVFFSGVGALVLTLAVLTEALL